MNIRGEGGQEAMRAENKALRAANAAMKSELSALHALIAALPKTRSRLWGPIVKAFRLPGRV